VYSHWRVIALNNRTSESFDPAEPFLFRTDTNGVKEIFAKRQLEPTENLTPRDIEKRYLTLKDGSIAEKSLSFFCFAAAKINMKQSGKSLIEVYATL
jgi:hypothetical protein